MKKTIGIVLVCHSSSMAQSFIDFCSLLKQEDFELINGAGSSFGIGTTVETVKEAIKKANRGKGVLVIVDFGSSIMNAQKAQKLLEGEIEVEIADAPFVEGTISAIVANDENISLQDLKIIAEDSRNSRKIKGGK